MGGGRWSPASWDSDRAWPCRDSPLPPHVLRVTVPNLVAAVCGRGKGPKNLGRWGPPLANWDGGVANPVEICPSRECYRAEFDRSRSNGTRVLMNIHRKEIEPDTRIDRLPDLLLVIHTMDLSGTCSLSLKRSVDLRCTLLVCRVHKEKQELQE